MVFFLVEGVNDRFVKYIKSRINHIQYENAIDGNLNGANVKFLCKINAAYCKLVRHYAFGVVIVSYSTSIYYLLNRGDTKNVYTIINVTSALGSSSVSLVLQFLVCLRNT